MSAAAGTAPRLDPLDPLGIEGLPSDDERAGRDEVGRFVEERFAPDVEQLFEDARWPRELAGELGRLGLLGMHLDGYGCAGASAMVYGLARLELEAGDGGLRTFVSVQGSLAMTAIHTALRHAGEHEQFGGPIARFQLVQAKLADMACAVAQGTDEVRTLILGHALTGIRAFA